MAPLQAAPPPVTIIPAVPLTAASFSPFGSVIENPRPRVTPQSLGGSSDRARTLSSLSLRHPASMANQGHAVKYEQVAQAANLYAQAPSGTPAVPWTCLFVCAQRPLGASGAFDVKILERHPFTTQTFIPLAARPQARYLVIVAPSLPPSAEDACFAVPSETEEQVGATTATTTTTTTTTTTPCLPGRGLPDVRNLRAFVARPSQAVMYGAGTWHAPMVVIPDEGGDEEPEAPLRGTIDFVTVQFVNGVAEEDLHEVEWDEGRVFVRIEGEQDGGVRV